MGTKGWYQGLLCDERCFVMSDAWMDKYCYQVVIDKKYLTPEQQKASGSKANRIEAMEPNGNTGLI